MVDSSLTRNTMQVEKAPRFSFPALTILVIILFLLLLASRPKYETGTLEVIISGVLFALNAAVFGAWFVWGVTAGGITTIICSLICIAVAVAGGSVHWLREILLFTGTGVFCYGLLERERKSRYRVKMVFEEIQERRNTLHAQYDKHRLENEALRGRIESYRMLTDVARSLASSLDFGKTVWLIVRRTLEVIGREGICLLYLADLDGQRLALKASWKGKVKLKTGDEFDHWVLKRGQVLLVEDVEKDFRFGLSDWKLRERKVGSLISAPLIAGERTVGLLRVDSEKPDAFATDDLRLLDVLAVLAAVSIENAQLYQRTEELAITDGLTGLYVHRYFRERLGEELRRATRSQSPLSFLMIDIDHFKDYNDRYGHTIGDIVLKKVSGVLKKKAGGGSIVARYGGEEFAIVLPRMGKNTARGMAETIRKMIAEKCINVRREKTNITVSIGVAAFPVDAVVEEDIISRADQALLRAKKDGRNKVCAA